VGHYILRGEGLGSDKKKSLTAETAGKKNRASEAMGKNRASAFNYPEAHGLLIRFVTLRLLCLEHHLAEGKQLVAAKNRAWRQIDIAKLCEIKLTQSQAPQATGAIPNNLDIAPSQGLIRLRQLAHLWPRGGLSVSALFPGSSGPGSSPGWGHI